MKIWLRSNFPPKREGRELGILIKLRGYGVKRISTRLLKTKYIHYKLKVFVYRRFWRGIARDVLYALQIYRYINIARYSHNYISQHDFCTLKL